MIEQLKHLYRGVAVHANEDEEHEAALAVLVLMMLSDSKLRVDEQEEIESLVIDADWENDTFSLAGRLGPATFRARQARTSAEATDLFLGEAAIVVASRVLRRELVAACRAVADADHERAEAEDSLLARIVAHFG